MKYLPCELHCHTVHSDGSFQVAELLKTAADDDLALIALTDHNTTSGYDELDDTLPVIKGIEWTTYFGHMLVLGAKSFVDWRNATPNNIDSKISQVKDCDGLVGVAHPFQLGSPICTGGRWDFNVKDWNNVDYIEIWHQVFSKDNTENEPAVKMWTSLLDKGYHISATYGRDWHSMSKGHIGCTYIGFEGEVTPDNALTAIKSGKTVVSTGAKFFFNISQNGTCYQIGDTVPKGDVTLNFFTDTYARRKNMSDTDTVDYQSIRIISKGGKCVKEVPFKTAHIQIKTDSDLWYRCELWGSVKGDFVPLAITSPFYTK